MQGGINNAALFGASQRSARDKLEIMGGIKRGPSGILASSVELMQAAAPRPMAPPPPMPMAPPPQPVMPMIQPVLPQVPMQTVVAPVVPQVPRVPQPVSPSTPMKFNKAGPVEVEGRPRRSMRIIDITQDPMVFINQINQQTNGAVVEKFGSLEDALKEGRKKKEKVEAVLAKTENPKEVADVVLTTAEVDPTDENKKDFAQSVLGIDTNNIGEIDDAIFRTLTSDPSLSGERLQAAVLLSLQNYKQTAAARAAAASGGKSGGMSPLEPFADAVRDLAGKIMSATGEDPEVAMRKAAEQLAPYYSGQVTASQPAQTPTGTPTLEEFLKVAGPKNPETSVEDLTKYYNDTYGG